jgi:flagellin
MSSVLTNSSALTALQNLNNTQRSLSKTQNQISTGLKVASAADNATNWSVSTQMKSDNSVLSTVKDTLKQNSAMLKTTVAALNEIVTTITDIKTQLSQAADAKDKSAAGYKAINTSLAGLAETVKGLVEGATFNGTNLLNTFTGNTNIISGFQSTTTAGGDPFKKIALTATDMAVTGSGGLKALYDGVKATAGVNATGANIASLTVEADKALLAVRELAAGYGAAQNQIDAQTRFVEVLSDSLTNGVSSMVDADMNEASTRLQALQTQQQLGVQSLSIANQNSQMILKLFQ